MEYLDNTINQKDVTNLYNTPPNNGVEYTFFLSINGTPTKMDHFLDHKTNLSNFKRIEIIQNRRPDRSNTKPNNNKMNK